MFIKDFQRFSVVFVLLSLYIFFESVFSVTLLSYLFMYNFL